MKKNGFTLIELLAVIVMIIIIVGLGAPALISVLKNNKLKADDKIMEIVESAARSYMIDYDSTMVCIEELCDKAYLSCPITNVSTNQSIDECIAISNANGTENYIYGTPSIPLEIDLNGGEISNDLSGNYISGMTLILPTPTKFLSNFSGWQVTSGTNSRMINDNVIFIGSTATSVKAIWDVNSYLITYNCNGGIGNNLVQLHSPTSHLVDNWCTKPILEGQNGMIYYFKGWSRTTSATNAEYLNKANVSSVAMVNNRATLYAIWGNLLDITGSYEVIDDDNDNWRIKFYGETAERNYGIQSIKFELATNIDVFLVGGGGNGMSGSGNEYMWFGGGGGGGGYTNTYRNLHADAIKYIINIGDSTIDTTGFAGIEGYPSGLIAAAGENGGRNTFGYGIGGNGGSGGGGGVNAKGGSDGNSGSANTDASGGLGQKNESGPNGESGNTREFGEETGEIYSYGGGIRTPQLYARGSGGRADYNADASFGIPGIVIIRNARL